MLKYPLLSMLLQTAVLASQADTLQTNLTLQAALRYGAENNPKVQSAFHQWKGAEENIAVQKALPDPMLTYGYYFESVETKVGPQNQQFKLAQTIPGFGKISAKKAIAAAAAASMMEGYHQEKLNLDLMITQAYAELYYLKRSIDITGDSISLMQELEQVARTRYRSGSPMAPLLQAQVELGRLEDRLASLNDLREPRVARLNAALNRPVNAPLPWPADLPYSVVEVDETRLLSELNRTSHELAALVHNVEQGSHRVQLARRERLPDFTLGVQYIQTGDSSTPVTDSGKDPIIGTIGINLPLWPGKNRARVAAADYQKTAAQLTLENREQTLDADIQQTLYKLRDADRQINLYKDSLIPKAEQSLEVNRKAFEAGQMEFINLIDAERMLLEFELSHERALANHLKYRAELSMLTGKNYLSDGSNKK
ncbi:TolC family protein [Pontiella sp.]|uniref:TolC family protein n=1 Tax=Pontiella sp. TaxID=2837462 RepID=UPI00356B44E0